MQKKHMIVRDIYTEQLSKFIDKPQVKVITGIRRSGKSTVLALLKEELLRRDVKDDHILRINFESFNFISITDAPALYSYVKDRINETGRYYILLDEIQVVGQWEKAINAFLVDFDVDIYITGSNSNLLSSELSTFLAGRYVELSVYPLSFGEYLKFRKFYFPLESADFMSYLRLGGFPVIHTVDYDQQSAYKVVHDIYSSAILRDTVQRYKVRNVELLDRVIKYVFDNIGNTFSGKNVADYFKSQNRKIDIDTIYNYLYALEGAFIIYRVPRYDLKGKEILKTQEKFFVSDVSLIYANLGFRERMIAGILENIVFLELKRRGYQVYIGKLDNVEIDFVGEKLGQRVYVQVAYKLESESTVQREFTPLITIEDQYPKYVVTMDDFWKQDVKGVKHMHISDFLLAN